MGDRDDRGDHYLNSTCYFCAVFILLFRLLNFELFNLMEGRRYHSLFLNGALLLLGARRFFPAYIVNLAC
jgi:hypothetical protein